MRKAKWVFITLLVLWSVTMFWLMSGCAADASGLGTGVDDQTDANHSAPGLVGGDKPPRPVWDAGMGQPPPSDASVAQPEVDASADAGIAEPDAAQPPPDPVRACDFDLEWDTGQQGALCTDESGCRTDELGNNTGLHCYWEPDGDFIDDPDFPYNRYKCCLPPIEAKRCGECEKNADCPAGFSCQAKQCTEICVGSGPGNTGRCAVSGLHCPCPC
jgi:hypothetical protein